MADQRLPRRRVLALTGGLTASLAGCTSQSGTQTHEERTTTGSGEHHDDEHGEASGNESHDHGGDSPSESREHATVKMVTGDDGSHFQPHVVWLTPGGTVTWDCESGTHTATAYHPDNDAPQRVPDGTAAFDSGSLSESSAPFEHTFETAGVYDYFCRPHEASGMLGTVVVGEPDPHGQPGLAEPQSALPNAAGEKLTSLNEQVSSLLDGH